MNNSSFGVSIEDKRVIASVWNKLSPQCQSIIGKAFGTGILSAECELSLMANEIEEIDAACKELSKVTSLTKDEYINFIENSRKQIEELNSTIKTRIIE